VPVLFGSGKRLFENLGSEHIQLEAAPEMIATPSATHLRYVVKKTAVKGRQIWKK